MTRMIALVLMIALVGAVGCKSESETAQADSAAAPKKVEKAVEQAKPAESEIMSKPSGVRYQELVVGKGVEATLGLPLQCHYTLWLADSTGLQKGKFIQSSKDSNQPFTCTLGQNLINGWSDGMVGMKEGGTRRIFIPWEQGYGERGMGAMIPPKSNLIFEIDFLKSMK